MVNRPRIAVEAGLLTALVGGAGVAAGSFLSAAGTPVGPAQTVTFGVVSTAVVGSRAWWVWRQQMTEILQASIWSEVGANRVRLSGGLGLVPSRVVVKYTPAIEGGDRSPSFAAQLTDIVSSRTGARFRLHRLDLVRCKAIFRRVGVKDVGTEMLVDAQGLILARATRTANELLRGTAVLSEPRWDDAGRLTRFAVRHQVGTMVATIAQQARIERIMSTMLPGRWRAHWDHENDKITFTLRSELASSIPHPVTDPALHPYRLPFGVDEDGHTLYWTLRGPGSSPHLLVVGKTGTGKSLDSSTIVPTESGWRTMGEIRDGDRLFDEHGQLCTVVKAHPVRYGRPCYRVTFSDGTEIVADAEHLWYTESRYERANTWWRRQDYLRAPRQLRLPADVLERLEQLRQNARADSAITLRELARLAGMSDTHPAIVKVGHGLNAVHCEAQQVQCLYSARQVRQTQTIVEWDGPAARRVLGIQEDLGTWASTSRLAELTGRDRGSIRSQLKNRNLEYRSVRRELTLQVPAKAVTRASRRVRHFRTADAAAALLGWGTGVRKSRAPQPTGAVRTTEEIRRTLTTAQGARNHAVPVMSAAANYPARVLPVPPYTLGAWLGDGSSRAGTIYGIDPEVAHEIQAEGLGVVDRGVPKGRPRPYQVHTYVVTGLTSQLRRLGVLTRRRGERRKHIPQVYLTACASQRRALLAGLLDTDGTVARTGQVQFDTVIKPLAKQVQQLACSLGYRASVTSKRATLDGQDWGTVYRVGFTTSDEVFRLPRKQVRHQESLRTERRVRTSRRLIISVDPVPSVPVRCLTVDSPSSLFCVGENYVPTHNTVCLVGIIAEITRRGWPVWLGDPKRVEFIGLRDWPNVQLVATTVHEQTAMVHRALEVMEYRYACIEAGEADEHSWDPLFVVLDEYRDFFGALRSWYARSKGKGAPSAAPVLEALGSLVRKGRTAGVHFIIGTQRPDSDFFGGEMRDNFHARISLGALSPQGAQMMWEAPHVGVAVPMIKGRGTAISPDEQPVEFQAYWTPDPHPRKLRPGSSDEVLLQSVRPQEDRWEKLAVLPPSAQDVREAASEYMAWAAAPLVAVADHPELAHSVNQAKHLRDKLPVALRSLGPRGRTSTDLTDDAPGPGERPPNVPHGAEDRPVSSAAAAAAYDRPAAAPDAAGLTRDEEETDLDVDEHYQAPDTVIVDELATETDALVLIDENTDTWGVVESVEPDPLEDSMLCVCWRDVATGESSLISVASGEVVTVRRANQNW